MDEATTRETLSDLADVGIGAEDDEILEDLAVYLVDNPQNISSETIETARSRFNIPIGIAVDYNISFEIRGRVITGEITGDLVAEFLNSHRDLFSQFLSQHKVAFELIVADPAL